jgi:hypothetical protein
MNQQMLSLNIYIQDIKPFKKLVLLHTKDTFSPPGTNVG